MAKRTVDHLCIEMLLDGDDAGLERLANNLKRKLDVVLGRKCPMCGGSDVVTNDESGVCHDCDETYDLPTETSYDRDGNEIEY